MRHRMRACVVLLVLMAAPLAGSRGSAQQSATVVESYVPVHAFDGKRDAAADIQAAVAEAARTHKRVLLYLGGNWCPYCEQMAQMFAADHDLLVQRDAAFITVYVHYGPGNYNLAAIKPYGEFVGVPHFFVLGSDGALLASQHLLELRENASYSPGKMREFLAKWTQREASMPPQSAGENASR